MLLCSPCLCFAQVPQQISARVLIVIDGDTLLVRLKSHKFKVRVFGIDCPERGQAGFTAAKHFTSRNTLSNQVVLRLHGKDIYGRTLADIILEGDRNLAYELLEEGLCWWRKKYAGRDKEFKARAMVAKANRRGIWAHSNSVPPWIYRHGKPSAGGRILPTEISKIMGNRKSKLYHLPNCPGYRRVLPQNRRWFDNELQAQHAGYQRAGNCKTHSDF